jgi:hypothetical protein
MLIFQEIMKKKDAKLVSPSMILKIFKAKALSFKGMKDHTVKNKLAIAYYMESNQFLCPKLITEEELHMIISNGSFDILAIQLFLSGWPFKSSGIFEHRYIYNFKSDHSKKPKKEQSKHEIKFETFELICQNPDYLLNCNIYNENLPKLIILESQHEMIKTMTKRLIKYIEMVTAGRIYYVNLEYIFSACGLPILRSIKDLRMDSIPPVLYRNEMIFMSGEPPYNMKLTTVINKKRSSVMNTTESSPTDPAHESTMNPNDMILPLTISLSSKSHLNPSKQQDFIDHFPLPQDEEAKSASPIQSHSYTADLPPHELQSSSRKSYSNDNQAQDSQREEKLKPNTKHVSIKLNDNNDRESEQATSRSNLIRNEEYGVLFEDDGHGGRKLVYLNVPEPKPREETKFESLSERILAQGNLETYFDDTPTLAPQPKTSRDNLLDALIKQHQENPSRRPMSADFASKVSFNVHYRNNCSINC